VSPRELVDADLLDRCKRGDEAAWAELVEATHREVYTLCLRILRDPDDAAEATQDAFVKAWRGLKRFRGEAAFTTWLYRIAFNAAISRQRSRARRWAHETESENEVLAQMPSGSSVESAAGARVEVERLQRALTTLPESYRSAVVMRDVYGMSIEEIARAALISQTAAKVRVHRGRKRLKELMYPDEAGGGDGDAM
jgi:RNA polymerase sigma-70 factor, ECF subfamily